MKLCSWCDTHANIKLVDQEDSECRAWYDYACELHAIEYSDTYYYTERIST